MCQPVWQPVCRQGYNMPDIYTWDLSCIFVAMIDETHTNKIPFPVVKHREVHEECTYEIKIVCIFSKIPGASLIIVNIIFSYQKMDSWMLWPALLLIFLAGWFHWVLNGTWVKFKGIVFILMEDYETRVMNRRSISLRNFKLKSPVPAGMYVFNRTCYNSTLSDINHLYLVPHLYLRYQNKIAKIVIGEGDQFVRLSTARDFVNPSLDWMSNDQVLSLLPILHDQGVLDFVSSGCTAAPDEPVSSVDTDSKKKE
jgi:hypothetical protein